MCHFIICFNSDVINADSIALAAKGYSMNNNCFSSPQQVLLKTYLSLQENINFNDNKSYATQTEKLNFKSLRCFI